MSFDHTTYRRQRRLVGLDRPVRLGERVTTQRAVGMVVVRVPDPDDFAHPESDVRSQP